MYQKVSMASWCRPVDWPPALIAQMLNQPAFLIVPSGFSTISVWLRGSSEIVPWAPAAVATSHAPAANATRCSVFITPSPSLLELPRGFFDTVVTPPRGVNTRRDEDHAKRRSDRGREPNARADTLVEFIDVGSRPLPHGRGGRPITRAARTRVLMNHRGGSVPRTQPDLPARATVSVPPLREQSRRRTYALETRSAADGDRARSALVPAAGLEEGRPPPCRLFLALRAAALGS